MATFVSSERRDAVALVTIDNPPMNALSAALLEELEAELDALDADDGVRAIVLRGAGDRAFVAGADIKEFPALRESASEGGSARGIQQVGRRMDAARTPFVAAIRGYCLGGGLELAMCCDLRICADDATLGQPEIKLGLIPGGGGTQRLPRLVGHGRRLVEQFHEHGHHLASRLPDPSQRRRRLPPAEPRRLRIAHDRDQPRNRAFDFGSREVEIGNPPPPLLECKTVVPPLRVPGGRNVRLTR